MRLISAFELERTLVLSVPATSETLQEIGQRLHAGRTKRRTRTGGGESEQRLAAEFHEQVSNFQEFISISMHRSIEVLRDQGLQLEKA